MNHMFLLFKISPPAIRFIALFRVSFLAMAFAAFCNPSSAEDSDSDTLKFLAESYLQHRASFPNLKVVYDWTKVVASTEDDAFADKFTSRSEPERCTLITSRDRRRFEFTCGPVSEAMFAEQHRNAKPSSGKMETAVACMSWILVDANGYSLRYDVSGHIANLHVPNGDRDDGVRVSPFDLDTMGSDGVSSPARYINDALSGTFKYRYLGALNAGQPDIGVEITGKQQQLSFFFDPTHAYMLSRIICIDIPSGSKIYEMRVLASKECSGGRWIPTRAVRVSPPKGNLPQMVYELNVVDVNPDYESTPSDWEVELPPDQQISISGEVQWTRTSKDHSERFGPDSFAELHARCVARGKEYVERRKVAAEAAESGLMRTSENAARVGRTPRVWLYALNIAFLVSVILLVLRRRGRSK